MQVSNDNNDNKYTYWDPDAKKWKTFGGEEQDFPEYDPNKPKEEKEDTSWGNW
jgi:hypothetical protein